MKRSELMQGCRELMAVSAAVYVTSPDESGDPYTRAMFNLRNRTQFPHQARLHASCGEDLASGLGAVLSDRPIGS